MVVENEGNAGLSTATPPVHVALIGIEKMLPRIDDLPLMLNLLARSGTGQKLTSYTHLIHGPAPGKKLYVILLDNGRSNVLKDHDTWAALHCIRCGACLNNCPVYRRVGGWAYGWVYPGPIGSILTPHLLGLKTAGKLPFASSLCGACAEVCPVKIDIAHQLVHLRNRAVNEPSPMNSLFQRVIWTVWAWLMGGPLRYKLATMGLRMGMPLIEVFAAIAASEHVGRLDPRPRVARGARPRFPPLVAAKQGQVRTMTSRDTILQRVRGELSKYPPVAVPAAAEVWPRTNPAPAAMAEQFARELTAVQGEVIRCATMDEARRRLAELAAKEQWTAIGAMDRPMVREATAELPPGVVRWAAAAHGVCR